MGRNRWVTMDVGWATRPGQLLGVAVVSTNADVVSYDSQETGTNGPQLVVTYEVAPPAQTDTLYAVGDIAKCNTQGDEATSALLDGTTGTIVTLGDTAYPDGSAANFSDCFGPSWGRHKPRIKPTTGNREYQTSPTATPYFDYFGAAAGDPAKGYYSYDIGAWHIVALNSDCGRVGGCVVGSPEEQWLRADLAATAKPCIAAYWHYPLFTSSAESAPTQTMQPFWQALYDAGADLVLNGHAHGYERFALQSPSGAADPVRGVRQIIAATGGADLYRSPTPRRPTARSARTVPGVCSSSP